VDDGRIRARLEFMAKRGDHEAAIIALTMSFCQGDNEEE